MRLRFNPYWGVGFGHRSPAWGWVSTVISKVSRGIMRRRGFTFRS